MTSCRVGTMVVSLITVGWIVGSRLAAEQPDLPVVDPAAWGSDHVDQSAPEYTDSGECLFCHRADVGPTWDQNRHQQQLRAADSDDPAMAALDRVERLKNFAGEVTYLLGGANSVCYLKPSQAHGKACILTARYTPASEQRPEAIAVDATVGWDEERYGQQCAGCHSTAVDPKTVSFGNVALDCYSCHGMVPVEHADDGGLALLSRQQKKDVRVVTSLCASCHVRTGKSRSNGRPYPNNFIPGDNLFRDLQVDFSDAALARLDPIDAHVVDNVRAVALHGDLSLSCLDCHVIHKPSTDKHRRIADSDYCNHCHEPGESKAIVKSFSRFSETCGYGTPTHLPQQKEIKP